VESTARWTMSALVLSVSLAAVGMEAVAQEIPDPQPGPPSIEEYATIESTVSGVPVYSFSSIVYIYGVSPDILPGIVMQEGNANPKVKIKPKKSWEIKHNLCGSEHEMMPRSARNDHQRFLLTAVQNSGAGSP
jgi:heme/copper-type cytochrome/quinol oxidase subunit 2